MFELKTEEKRQNFGFFKHCLGIRNVYNANYTAVHCKI